MPIIVPISGAAEFNEPTRLNRSFGAQLIIRVVLAVIKRDNPIPKQTNIPII